MNISAQHLKSLKGKNSWRDIGVKLTGPSVLDLDLAFESFWSRKKFTLNLVRSPIRINSDLLTRRKNYKDLVRHILNAKKHICIATAYFVPHWSILKAIKWVANKGVTVEIMVTKRSDVSIMPWIARTFYPSLLYAGVKIFEFMPSVLHAKCILVDDWLILGSSNFNHRSVFLDFELDVVLTSEESILKTKLFFQETKELSHEINLENLPQTLSFFQKILSNFILVLRKWL